MNRTNLASVIFVTLAKTEPPPCLPRPKIRHDDLCKHALVARLKNATSCVSVSAKMMSRSLRLAAATAVATCLAASSAGAFQPISSSARPITALSAAQRNSNAYDEEDVSSLLGGVRGIAAAFTLFAMTTLSGPAGAVSGGGLDYANLDITGQDFSNEAKAYKGKDFSVSR
jgi:hypothetical protein